jgi:orotate phosphoribosyltransferase
MERGTGELSAVQEVQRDYRIPVVAVACLDDLMTFLRKHPDFKNNEAAVACYREEYGVAHNA